MGHTKIIENIEVSIVGSISYVISVNLKINNKNKIKKYYSGLKLNCIKFNSQIK